VRRQTYAEAKGVLDEKRVESVQTPNNKRLEENHSHQEPRHGVKEGFLQLVVLELFLLDSLIVLAYSFDEFDFLFRCGPSSLRGGIGQEDQDEDCIVSDLSVWQLTGATYRKPQRR